MGAFDDLLAANREFAGRFALSGFDGVAHAGIAMVTALVSLLTRNPRRSNGVRIILVIQ